MACRRENSYPTPGGTFGLGPEVRRALVGLNYLAARYTFQNSLTRCGGNLEAKLKAASFLTCSEMFFSMYSTCLGVRAMGLGFGALGLALVCIVADWKEPSK